MELTDQVALSLTPASRRRVWDAFAATEQLDGSLPTALELLGGVAAKDAERLQARARSALASAAAHGVRAVPIGDQTYPALLATIADPPLLLWVAGNVDVFAAPAIAVVGSRAAAPASLEVAHSLSRDLAERGVVVVSGLARGCDGAAHRGALASDGVTVAVLGCGPDVVYPVEHGALATTIRHRGALVSELPPGTPPLPHHFPLRNRIISGLALGVVVVQADERSGSLITAACGLEQGREVMAVPGGVPGGRNRGSHALLKDGAQLVETAEDVLEGLPLLRQLLGDGRSGVDGHGDGGHEDPILGVLAPGEDLDVDELAERSGLETTETLTRLGGLELGGRIARLPGGRFVRLSGK
jgi:DNA processing protein